MDYRKHYDRLIERARSRTVDGYTERHHVIPRCLGGSDASENLVRLTAEEHYLAHLLLVRLNPGVHGLVLAVMQMSGRSGPTVRRSNKFYGWLRRRHSEYMKNRYISPETLARM